MSSRVEDLLKIWKWTAFWLGLFTVAHFTIVENEWIVNCRDFCIQLGDSILEKLSTPQGFIEFIVWLGLVVTLMMLFIALRMICKKSS